MLDVCGKRRTANSKKNSFSPPAFHRLHTYLKIFVLPVNERSSDIFPLDRLKVLQSEVYQNGIKVNFCDLRFP